MEAPSNSPPELLFCRGCLSMVNLCDIHNNQLAETFERVTGILVWPGDGLPQRLCGICCSMLAKSAAFRERSRRTQHCLKSRHQHEITLDYIKSIDRLSHGLVFSLALTQVEIIDLGNSPKIKTTHEPFVDHSYTKSLVANKENEIISTLSSEIKDEVNYLDKDNRSEVNNELDCLNIDNVLESSTDFDAYQTNEVDQALDTNIQEERAQTPSTTVVLENPVRNEERPHIDYLLKSQRDNKPFSDFAQFENECNVNTRVLNLEQQLAEWELSNARKKKPAAFRCEECGKGFAQQDTYSKHKMKHNPLTIDRLSHDLVYTLAITKTEIVELGNTKQNKVINELFIDDSETVLITENDTLDHLDPFGLKTEAILDHSDVDNILESPTDFNRHEADEKNETHKNVQIEKNLLTIDEVKVKQEKGQKVKKKNAQKKARPRTSKELLNFNIAKFENDFNVNIEVLNMEQQKADWEEHKARKKRPAAFRCGECGKGLDHQESYNNHMLRHDPSAGEHACAVCRVRFRRRNDRRMHERAHAMRLVCRECGFVSRTRQQAKTHFNTHAGQKHECKYCGRVFIKVSSYFSHVRLVHAARGLSCGECGEAFVSQHGLSHHQARIHKPRMAASKSACPTCGVVFHSAVALASHTRASEADGCDPTVRPCAVCGASLPTEEALLAHVEERHTEQFECPECPLKFPLSSSRDVHHRRAHLLVSRDRDLRARRSLAAGGNRDRQQHGSRVCDTCGRQCQSTTYLKLHQMTHTGERPFPCTDCDMRFLTSSNMRRHHQVIHMGQRPQVPCPVCKKTVFAASLYTHMSGVHKTLVRQIRKKNRCAKK